MNPTDDRLRRELSRGPLKRDGFDERLRRRIEERLDEEPVRRPFRPFRLAGVGVTLCVMIATFVLLVRLHPSNTDESRQAAELPAPEAVSGAAAAVDDAEETSRRVVLLLGLRLDGADGEASAYRTLLVSGGPEPSDWSAAEGEGIVMPYRTDFWRLDVRESEGSGGVIRLAGAYNASRGATEPPALIPAASGLVGSIEERVLFAGNRYIAIARRTAGEWTHHMMEITDLAQPRNLASVAFGTEREVALQTDLDGRLGIGDTGGTGASAFGEWRFARKAGVWLGFGPAFAAGSAANAAERLEMAYTFGPTIVAHNELALHWNDIREVQPAAVDAVTSPIRNMAAILTDRKIVFYSMHRGKLDREMLELELRPGETVIMAEWATHVDYVDEWIRRVGALFEEERQSRSAD